MVINIGNFFSSNNKNTSIGDFQDLEHIDGVAISSLSANLYNEKTIAHNFINMDKVFIASEPINPSDKPYIFEKIDFSLPEKYLFEGSEHDLEEGLAHFKTD